MPSSNTVRDARTIKQPLSYAISSHTSTMATKDTIATPTATDPRAHTAACPHSPSHQYENRQMLKKDRELPLQQTIEQTFAVSYEQLHRLVSLGLLHLDFLDAILGEVQNLSTW